MPFSRGSSQPREWTGVSWICRWILYLSEPPGRMPGVISLILVMHIGFKRKENRICYVDCFNKGFLKTWNNVSVHLHYLSGILWRHRWAACFPKHCCYCHSVNKSCPTLCNPMDRSMPGFPLHHQLPELAQTHVHPTISSSVVLFSSRLQSFPASGSFPLSQFFPSGGQSRISN